MSVVFSTAGCASQFEQIVDANEQNFHVQCDKSETLFGSSLEECKVTACNYSTEVFHYLDNVCEVLQCGESRREDLKLTPVTNGWNIYFKTEANSAKPLTTTGLSTSDADEISTDVTHIPTETASTNPSISSTNDSAPLLPSYVFRPSGKPVFSEPVKQINAKFGGNVSFHRITISFIVFSQM